MEIDRAEHAIDCHSCPSCGKDFVITSWKQIEGKKNQVQRVLSTTNYCRFCGLTLFRDCASCGNENFVHLPFCGKCGVPTESKKDVENKKQA